MLNISVAILSSDKSKGRYQFSPWELHCRWIKWVYASLKGSWEPDGARWKVGEKRKDGQSLESRRWQFGPQEQTHDGAMEGLMEEEGDGGSRA